MTDQSDQTPLPPSKTRRSSRKRPHNIVDTSSAESVASSPPLNPGPGRPCSLDPDQKTLDENIQRLNRLATAQSTLDEAAASLGVSLDTLYEFFKKYPNIKEKFEDSRRSGTVPIRGQLYKNLAAGNPQTAMWMGERLAGILDPHTQRELDLKERDLARREKELERTMELKQQELDQRERALMAEKHGLEDFRGGPIDIKSLSLKQLMDLSDRIKQGMNEGPALTLEAIRHSPKPGGEDFGER